MEQKWIAKARCEGMGGTLGMDAAGVQLSQAEEENMSNRRIMVSSSSLAVLNPTIRQKRMRWVQALSC